MARVGSSALRSCARAWRQVAAEGVPSFVGLPIAMPSNTGCAPAALRHDGCLGQSLGRVIIMYAPVTDECRCVPATSDCTSPTANTNYHIYSVTRRVGRDDELEALHARAVLRAVALRMVAHLVEHARRTHRRGYLPRQGRGSGEISGEAVGAGAGAGARAVRATRAAPSSCRPNRPHGAARRPRAARARCRACRA